MKFLVDAQLPRIIVSWFNAAGCDAIHTLDLSARNRTPDTVIVDLADLEQRVVVTKDADFVDSHFIHRRPAKLLLVSTGNLNNEELGRLILPLLPSIAREFVNNDFIEIGFFGIIVRG